MIVSRLVPSVVLGQFQQHDTSGPAVAPERATLTEAPLPPVPAKTETTVPREVLEQPKPAGRRAMLPDEVVMHLIESGRAVFVRCFKQAYAADPTVVSFKVHVYVEVDPDGTLTSASADTAPAELAACLTRSAKWLRYPASDQPVAVDLPLVYRVE